MSRPSSFTPTFSFSGLRCVRWVLGAAFALALLAAACGDEGTGPEGQSLTGTWTDTIQEIVCYSSDPFQDTPAGPICRPAVSCGGS